MSSYRSSKHFVDEGRGLVGTEPCHGQKPYLCNNQLYSFPHCACTYPGVSSQYSCSGQLTQTPNLACTYNKGPVSGVCYGVPGPHTAAGAVTASGTGAITGTSLLTAAGTNVIAVTSTGTVTGTAIGIAAGAVFKPSANALIQYSCNGALSPTATPDCTYPNPPLTGIQQGMSVPTCNVGPAVTGTPMYYCNGVLCPTPSQACFRSNTIRYLCGNVFYSFQCTAQPCYLCEGVCSTTPNPRCTYNG